MKTTKPNYRIYDRTGGGVTEDIHADSLESAIDQGREWIENGDWSGDNEDADGNRVYRTISLDCCVRKIVYRAPRPIMDGTESNRISDLLDLDCAPESIAGVDYDEMDRDQLATLADYLDSPDDSVSEEDQEFDSSIASQIRDALREDDEIDEDATDDGDSHDCSGTYSDELPDCEASPTEDVDGDADGHGHIWVSSYRCCGGLKENPGIWSNGGTRWTTKTVCKCCGMIKTETDPGCQRNPDEEISTVTLEDRTDETTEWLKDQHEDDGWLPQWLCDLLDCSPTTRMTEEQAAEYVAEHADDDDLDEDDLEHAFAATFGRRADDQDRAEGLWSHLNAAA